MLYLGGSTQRFVPETTTPSSPYHARAFPGVGAAPLQQEYGLNSTGMTT